MGCASQIVEYKKNTIRADERQNHCQIHTKRRRRRKVDGTRKKKKIGLRAVSLSLADAAACGIALVSPICIQRERLYSIGYTHNMLGRQYLGLAYVNKKRRKLSRTVGISFD